MQSDINGIKDIIGLKAAMNWGLSDKLKSEFLNVISAVLRSPTVTFNGIAVHAKNWLSGFVDGEGCFYIDKKKSLGRLRPT